MPSTISVRGHAVVSAQPDQVLLGVEVSYLDQTPEAALREVTTRSQTLEAIFAELSISNDRWTTAGATVHEQTEYDSNQGRQVHRGYLAANRIQLRLADAALVGKLMNEATSRASARISGPQWNVAPDNPARLEACRQAALDARRKADAYAAALNTRLGAIVSVAEPGIEPREPLGGPKRMMMAASADAAPELTVQAGALEVSAVVVVTFAIEQG
jgi:uncharacterized protein YggE